MMGRSAMIASNPKHHWLYPSSTSSINHDKTIANPAMLSTYQGWSPIFCWDSLPSKNHLHPGEVERKEQSTPFKTMLDDDAKRCHDCWIPHATLQSLKEPSFVTLFEPGDDQALIALTGFDHATFQELHKLFGPFFNAINISRMVTSFLPGFTSK